MYISMFIKIPYNTTPSRSVLILWCWSPHSLLYKNEAEEQGVYDNLLQLSWRVISILNRVLVLKHEKKNVKSMLEHVLDN